MSKIIYKIKTYRYYYDDGYTMTAQTWYIAMYCNKNLLVPTHNSNRDCFSVNFHSRVYLLHKVAGAHISDCS